MSQVTSQNALVKDTTVQTLNGKLDNLNATLGGNANIAPVFNTATAYSKGDMVNYNGDLYVFTANHSAGAWTGSDAVQTKVSSELSSLKSGLIEKVDQLTLVESSSQSDDDAIKNLFDDINIYDKPIVGAMGFQSWWVYIAYKYTGGNYGCIVAYRFDGTAKFLSVNAGVKTIKSFAFGS